jgi:hypothetical protein
MQRHTLYLYLETALHVSSGTSTNHKEGIQLYLQHLVFVTPLLLSAAIETSSALIQVLPEVVSWYLERGFRCRFRGKLLAFARKYRGKLRKIKLARYSNHI